MKRLLRRGILEIDESSSLPLSGLEPIRARQIISSNAVRSSMKAPSNALSPRRVQAVKPCEVHARVMPLAYSLRTPSVVSSTLQPSFSYAIRRKMRVLRFGRR